MQEMKMRLASADTGRKRHWIMNTKRFSQTNQRETFSLVGFNQKPKKDKTGKRFLQFSALTIAMSVSILGFNNLRVV